VTQANRAYDLGVTRDTIEVVEIASGEVVLFWDVAPDRVRRMARALRADLVALEPEAFLARWRGVEA
jgi:hypothetical protein